ncbi:uncharacterized protein LOC132785835 isoform X2 [Drosophila nasuta]|uniref:uncharacterized protein LOC132785835 isoform X2 n=1 Tax=Drosophila nasuta TaxID=42062 RepID=UPI00295EF93C|nr:uncharacterized protein LOC132785835 isoform X2 [Drosophila nasuta]
MASECAVGCVDAVVNSVKRKFNCIKQFWHRYLLVEPVLILFWAPTLFRFDKFVTYKACRFSLGYNEAVCSAVIYDYYYVRDCIPYYVPQNTLTILVPSPDELFVDASSPNFNYAVCKVGNQAQNLVNNVYLNTLPIEYFGICVGLEIVAILYIILFIKEPKSNESVSEVNDSAGDIQLTNLGDLTIQENVTNIESSSEPSRRNVFKKFFDPMLAIELFKLPFKRRHNNDRLILVLLILCYFLTAGPEGSETKFMDFHILNRIDFVEYVEYMENSHMELYYRLMKFMMSINLTFFGIITFAKIWKFSESIVGISESLFGIWTAVFVVVSRVLFHFADKSSIVSTRQM